MPLEHLFTSSALRVVSTRCHAGPADAAQPEAHASHVVAYVRAGSFGYRTRGRRFELVAGSLLIGHPGDEYVCTHDHHEGGDECLALHASPELVDELGGARRFGEAAGLPPLPELMLLGERVHASARGFTDAGPDELGVALIARMVRLRSGRRAKGSSTPCARDRRRAVEAALWIESNASRRISLADGASKVGLGPAHFLRLFARVVGVTPHQYLIRTRLRNAARLLAAEDRSATEIGLEVGFADLSNFVRTFHRAAGLSPGAFRRAPRAARVAALQRLSSR